uniref:Uncharacterized protein n=1 Tax=Rhizophora mucronata TaxID=61149 RepID=A0A2P2NRG2_RHIMU
MLIAWITSKKRVSCSVFFYQEDHLFCALHNTRINS